MDKIKTVLLICTGNSCRSVMAAGLLRKLLDNKANKDAYKVTTAGVAAYKGILPTKEAIQVMSDEKIDVSEHRSSPLTDEMINEADLILVMERGHKETILQRRLDMREKVHLLSEFGRDAKEDKLVDPDIADPIGKSLDFYRQVYNVIKESIIRTAKII